MHTERTCDCTCYGGEDKTASLICSKLQKLPDMKLKTLCSYKPLAPLFLIKCVFICVCYSNRNIILLNNLWLWAIHIGWICCYGIYTPKVQAITHNKNEEKYTKGQISLLIMTIKKPELKKQHPPHLIFKNTFSSSSPESSHLRPLRHRPTKPHLTVVQKNLQLPKNYLKQKINK